MHNTVAVGTLVPPDFNGSVFSVHDHAMNIKDDDDYRLISIVDREVDMTALSVLAPRLPGGMESGVRVRSTTAGIDIHKSSATLVSLEWDEQTPRFSGAVPAFAPGVSPSSFYDSLGRIRKLLKRLGARDGLYSIGTDSPADNIYARKAVAVLGPADRAGSHAGETAPGERLAGLVGLGPGFTPSGDDFICGALLAAELGRGFVSPADGATTFDINLRSILDRVSNTTIAGATLLALACGGSFPAYLVSFAQQVVSSVGVTQPGADLSVPGREEENAVRDAISHGATSGTDALSGFLWMAGARP